METKKGLNEEQKNEMAKRPEEVKKENLEKKKNYFYKGNNFLSGLGIGVFVMGLIAIILASFALISVNKNKISTTSALGLEEAKIKTEKFINDILIGDGGNKITIKEAGEEDNFYKIVVTTAEGQDIETYLTKDGKLFFDQQVMSGIMDIAKIEAEVQATKDAEATALAEIAKSDKPSVELFVMSHCPYGTQIEKGILPVVETLGSKIDFDIKFVDYAMHGETEINEELQQHCVKTEEPAKFINYLNCFLEDGDSDRCAAQAKINTAKINSCISATDKEFNIMANFADKTTYNGNYPTFNIYKESNTKYAVAGSPTLVINGIKMGESSCNDDSDCHAGEVCVNGKSGKVCSMPRNPESLKQAICATFNTAPEECATELSSAEPTPGFGFDTNPAGANSADASCE